MEPKFPFVKPCTVMDETFPKSEILARAWLARLPYFKLTGEECPMMTIDIMEKMLNDNGTHLAYHFKSWDADSIIYETNKKGEGIIHTYIAKNTQRRLISIASFFAFHTLFVNPTPKIEMTLSDWLSDEIFPQRLRSNWWAREFVFPLQLIEKDIASGMTLYDLVGKWGYAVSSRMTSHGPWIEELEEPRLWSCRQGTPGVIALKAAYGEKLTLWERLLLRFSKDVKKCLKRPDGDDITG